MLLGGVVCSMAFYCRRCGKIHVHDVPYFLGVRRFSLRCAGCAHEQAVLVRGDRKRWEIHVPCVACGKEHVIRLSLAQLRRMELEKVYCSADCFELGYIGQRRRIEELLAFNQAEFERLHPADGANFIGKQQILLEAVNRVHEFVAAGDVVCPCGSHDFIAQVGGDSVFLECSHCGRSAVIPAESEADLRRLLCGSSIRFLAPMAPNKR